MKKVKILGICGSPRNGSTLYALRQALAEAEKYGAETELVHLKGRKITPCIACDKCLREDRTECAVFQDDMTPLYQKFYDADGIIIASPVYHMCMTAQTLAFINRFRSFWLISEKDPDFFNRKVGAAISVGGTRNGGEETANASILNAMSAFGITLVNGGIGTYTGGCVWSDNELMGAEKDDIGILNCRKIGRKTAVMARYLQCGIEQLGIFGDEGMGTGITSEARKGE